MIGLLVVIVLILWMVILILLIIMKWGIEDIYWDLEDNVLFGSNEEARDANDYVGGIEDIYWS